MVRVYFHTYSMNVIITNCSNNYGPKKHDEKLTPSIIRKAILGEKSPIYGAVKNVRNGLYVLDHSKGVDWELKKDEIILSKMDRKLRCFISTIEK